MKQRSSALIAVIALVALVAAPSQIAAAPDNRDGVLRILLMGSSLIRGIKPNLQKILEAQGIEASIRSVAPSLRTLAWHAKSPRSAKFISGKRGQPWDYVILQENGGLGISESVGSYGAIRTLHQKIAPTGAKTLLFMVWRDRDVNPTTPGGNALWEQLRGSPGGHVGNVPIAFELDIGVIPVGWSIREARVEGGPPYDQSLYSGGIGHHLSNLGAYVGACAVFSSLTGESPINLWSPSHFGPQDIGFVQGIADSVVIDDAADWNLDLSNADY